MYKLDDVQEYLKNVMKADRVEELYNMIPNPQVRVNSDDKKWVAYSTQASENTTVIEAMREILGIERFLWVLRKEEVIEAVDKVGVMLESYEVKMKPRIPFYILVLDQLVD